MRVVGFLVIGLVTVAAFPAAAEAQIYTWRDANGTLVLSDRPMSPDAETASVAGSSRIRTTRRVSTLTRAGSYDRIIERYAARYGVRPDLVRAVIQVESAFDPNARSSKGAIGLMQLMPRTATEMGVINPYDPEQNIRGGVAYLQRLLDHYDGDEELALAAYNAGPGAVERHGNQIPPYPETQSYVEKIRSTTDVDGAGGRRAGQTIYKSFEVVDGRRVPVYTNIKPASEDYEVATRPRSCPVPGVSQVAPTESVSPLEQVRLDVWLDVACVFGTRSEAQRACKGGKVAVDGQRAKPHRDIRRGDRIAVTRANGRRQEIVVKELAERHLPKAEARTLYEDVTPPPSQEELEFRALLRRAGEAAPVTRGAPDKRDRRALRRLKGR